MSNKIAVFFTFLFIQINLRMIKVQKYHHCIIKKEIKKVKQWLIKRNSYTEIRVIPKATWLIWECRQHGPDFLQCLLVKPIYWSCERKFCSLFIGDFSLATNFAKSHWNVLLLSQTLWICLQIIHMNHHSALLKKSKESTPEL